MEQQKIMAQLNQFMKGTCYTAMLLGPKRCGKTYAIKQFLEKQPHSRYYDCRYWEGRDSVYLIDRLMEDMKRHRYSLVVLDSYMYMEMPDLMLRRVSGLAEEFQTKIIIVGSQAHVFARWVEAVYKYDDSEVWTTIYMDFSDSDQLLPERYTDSEKQRYFQECVDEMNRIEKQGFYVIPGFPKIEIKKLKEILKMDVATCLVENKQLMIKK